MRSCRHPWLSFSLPRPSPDPAHQKCCPTYPTLIFKFSQDKVPRDGIGKLAVTWSGHLPLERRADGRFEAKDLERGLERLYRSEGRFICPPLMPLPFLGAQLGDAGRCDCVEYAGRTATAWERPQPGWQKGKTCRTDPAVGFAEQNTKSHAIVLGLRARDSRRPCYSKTTKLVSDRGRARLRVTQTVDIIGTSQHDRCRVVTYESHIQMRLGDDGRVPEMDWTWYHALDSDSYNLTKDAEGFGVYWCKSKGCSNYHRFTRSRLWSVIRPPDYVHPCPH